MKKNLVRLLLVLVLVLAGAVVGVRLWVGGWINRPQLIAEMEAGWNCRAEIGSTSLSLFSSPAEVVISKLQLAPRDEQVARPLQGRAPFDSSSALLTAGRVHLAVSLGDLLRRKAVVRQLRIEDFTLRDEEDGSDDSLLDILFAHPDDFEEAPPGGSAARGPVSAPPSPWSPPARKSILAPAALPLVAAEAAADGGSSPEARPRKVRRVRRKKEHKPFKASDLKIGLEAEEASVENAHIDLVNQVQKTLLQFDQVRLALKDVDVEPSDLAHHNACRLELGGKIRLEKTDEARVMADCTLAGSGTIKPFDPQSGEWNPDINLALTLRKGSVLGGAVIAEQLRGKDAAKLKQYGLELGNIALGGVLGEDASTEIHVVKNKLIVKQETRLVFPQYEIAVFEGSWIHGRSDNHNVRGEVVVGRELSSTILEQARVKLGAKYGDTIAGLAVKAVVSLLQDEKARLVIKFRSKGKLSKPDIDWDNPLNDLKDLLKDAGATLLNDLFGK